MKFKIWERVVIYPGRQRLQYVIMDNDGNEVCTHDNAEDAVKECDELNFCDGCDDPDCYCDG